MCPVESVLFHYHPEAIVKQRARSSLVVPLPAVVHAAASKQ